MTAHVTSGLSVSTLNRFELTAPAERPQCRHLMLPCPNTRKLSPWRSLSDTATSPGTRLADDERHDDERRKDPTHVDAP